jgi:hypothetical protein
VERETREPSYRTNHQAVRFRPAGALTLDAVAAITERVRVRVMRWFARSGLIATT